LRGDLVASAIVAATAFAALSAVICAPYGMSNGIWSGTGAAAGAGAGCACAAVADNAPAIDSAIMDLRIKFLPRLVLIDARTQRAVAP
jgi:hypothetical protein